MAALGKIVIGVGGIIFAIAAMVLIVPSEMRQQQATSNIVQQDLSQLNNVDLKLIGDCQTFQSVADLTGCKTQLSNLKSDCQNPTYSSMAACSDPRIDQFLSTVDSKISYAQNVISTDATKLNATYSSLLNQCSVASDQNTLASCKSVIAQMQQECNTLSSLDVPACNDPRITQILNKQIVPPSNVYDATSQSMESFINLCMIAQEESAVQDCSTKAKQMISLCQSTPVQACNDPRLQQVANMGQTTSETTIQSPVNATALNNLNNEMQTILNECTNSAASNSTTCINTINNVKQSCTSTLEKTYSSYFPVCTDPRLQ